MQVLHLVPLVVAAKVDEGAVGPGVGGAIVLERRHQVVREAIELYCQDAVERLANTTSDEKLATEEIIDLVGRGEIPLTVADMDLFTVTSLLRRDMDSYMVVSAGGERAFAVRPGSDALLLEINEFVESGDWQPGQDDPEPLEVGEDAATEVARRRLRSWPEALKWNPGPVLDMAREFASQHDLDWRLLVAKSAVASGHEPGATSWPGARGIYQMNPQKARDLGMGEVNLRNGAMATAAASTWLARSYDALPDTIQPADRWPMALAGFRVGVEHIRDAMELADAMGFPSQKWEGGVARALRLLERPMYASNARHGYCPGADAVVYAEQVLEAYGQMVKMHPDGGFTSGSRGAVPTP